jgi:hypothetical protein
MESPASKEIVLNVAIGQKVFELLNLKMNKKTGKIETLWGTKTIQGLGATIARIVREENERLSD